MGHAEVRPITRRQPNQLQVSWILPKRWGSFAATSMAASARAPRFPDERTLWAGVSEKS
jgi:hypothetical protein